MTRTTVRTSLALPSELLAAVDRLVRQGRSRSRSELIAGALRRELAEQERSAVDAEFRHMAHDVDYQVETRLLLAEFARSDWEALQKSRDQQTENPQP